MARDFCGLRLTADEFWTLMRNDTERILTLLRNDTTRKHFRWPALTAAQILASHEEEKERKKEGREGKVR
jgi:hypothetical protein